MIEVDRNDLPKPLDPFVLGDLFNRLEHGKPISKELGELLLIEFHRMRYRNLDMIAELDELRTMLVMADGLLDGKEMDEVKREAKKFVRSGFAGVNAANDQAVATVRDLVRDLVVRAHGDQKNSEDDCA